MKIFRPKEGGAGGWRKPCNEDLNNLYVTSNVIVETKSRRM